MIEKRKAENPIDKNSFQLTGLAAEGNNRRQIFDNLPDAVIAYSVAENGQVALADINSAGEKYGPATRKDIGKCIEEIYPADVSEWSYKIFNECITSGESITIKNQLVQGYDCPYHATASVIPAKNSEGVVVKLINVVRDVTDVKLEEQSCLISKLLKRLRETGEKHRDREYFDC